MATAVKNILGKGNFKVNGSLWLEKDGERFFGPGPVELLGLIEETGSINQAAKKMQMSYKKAWEMINNLNTVARQPLVITSTGGEKGGGSCISPEAKELVAHYRLLRQAFSHFMEEQSALLMQ